jgi:hypothetical protein
MRLELWVGVALACVGREEERGYGTWTSVRLHRARGLVIYLFRTWCISIQTPTLRVSGRLQDDSPSTRGKYEEER